MREFATAACLLIVMGCTKQTPESVVKLPKWELLKSRKGEPPLPQPSFPVEAKLEWVREPIADLTTGGWVLSRDWCGFMGAAFRFDSDGTFKYWFYSDVKTNDEPDYPVTGVWSWNGPILELSANRHVYDERWYVYRFHDQLTLLPEWGRERQLEDGQLHADRLLFRVAEFDESHPFTWQCRFDPEAIEAEAK